MRVQPLTGGPGGGTVLPPKAAPALGPSGSTTRTPAPRDRPSSLRSTPPRGCASARSEIRPTRAVVGADAAKTAGQSRQERSLWTSAAGVRRHPHRFTPASPEPNSDLDRRATPPKMSGSVQVRWIRAGCSGRGPIQTGQNTDRIESNILGIDPTHRTLPQPIPLDAPPGRPRVAHSAAIPSGPIPTNKKTFFSAVRFDFRTARF